jgi:hypothetical protein
MMESEQEQEEIDFVEDADVVLSTALEQEEDTGREDIVAPHDVYVYDKDSRTDPLSTDIRKELPFITFFIHSSLMYIAVLLPEPYQFCWMAYTSTATFGGLCGAFGVKRVSTSSQWYILSGPRSFYNSKRRKCANMERQYIQGVPAIVTMYMLIHSLALLYGTLILLSFIIPLRLHTTILPIPDVYTNGRRFCREMNDDPFNDEEWLERCQVRYMSVKMLLGALWSQALLAQWWAAYGLWEWNMRLKGLVGWVGTKRTRMDLDLEKGGLREPEVMPDEKKMSFDLGTGDLHGTKHGLDEKKSMQELGEKGS